MKISPWLIPNKSDYKHDEIRGRILSKNKLGYWIEWSNGTITFEKVIHE